MDISQHVELYKSTLSIIQVFTEIKKYEYQLQEYNIKKLLLKMDTLFKTHEKLFYK